MKGLSIAIGLAGGALLALYLTNDLSQTAAENPAELALYLLAYAIPLTIGIASLARPPLRAWQAGLALAAFTGAVGKSALWTQFARFSAYPARWKLWMVLLVAGFVVSGIALVLALARPEPRARA